MLISLKVKWNQFLEVAREKSPREALGRVLSSFVQLNRVVVPVYMELSVPKKAPKQVDSEGLDIIMVERGNVESVACLHKVASRRLKCALNTGRGYYAYAVVSNGEIIGDIWCATPRDIECNPVHPDLNFLGITCGENEAYMFDMYVVPDSRGKVVAGYLLANALRDLKEKGLSRVYGFYEKDNLPALWIHRLFGYTELGKRKVYRLLVYNKSEAVTSES